jgi:uncharacterized protein DUF3626
MLKACHTQALDFLRDKALSRKQKARENLEHILEMSNIDSDEFESAVSVMKRRAQVALHFHPDRLTSEGSTVAESLLATGLYKSQFETGISAGSVSAWPGGVRWEWEDKLFGGSYSTADVESADRPKYGALDLMRSFDGPAPRFGSCYILLKPRVNERCTYTYRDSHLEPPEKGTWEEFDDILSALMSESFERSFALGLKRMKPRHLVEHFLSMESLDFGPVSRNLDHYIEAQVHGMVDLRRDVTHAVVDSSYRGHDVGRQMEELARKNEFELVWRPAFSLSVDAVPSDFRGVVMPRFAARVAQEGRVDARLIGKASRSVVDRPRDWEEFGEPSHLLSLVKRLWHTTLKFGEILG